MNFTHILFALLSLTSTPDTTAHKERLPHPDCQDLNAIIKKTTNNTCTIDTIATNKCEEIMETAIVSEIMTDPVRERVFTQEYSQAYATCKEALSEKYTQEALNNLKRTLRKTNCKNPSDDYTIYVCKHTPQDIKDLEKILAERKK